MYAGGNPLVNKLISPLSICLTLSLSPQLMFFATLYIGWIFKVIIPYKNHPGSWPKKEEGNCLLITSFCHWVLDTMTSMLQWKYITPTVYWMYAYKLKLLSRLGIFRLKEHGAHNHWVFKCIVHPNLPKVLNQIPSRKSNYCHIYTRYRVQQFLHLEIKKSVLRSQHLQHFCIYKYRRQKPGKK